MLRFFLIHFTQLDFILPHHEILSVVKSRPQLHLNEGLTRTWAADDSIGLFLCFPLPTAADKITSPLPKFSQPEGHRRSRQIARKGGERRLNKGEIWHSQLVYACTVNAQLMPPEQPRRSKSQGPWSATQRGISHTWLVSQNYTLRMWKRYIFSPPHKWRQKKDKTDMTWRHLAFNFNQLILYFPGPSSFLNTPLVVHLQVELSTSAISSSTPKVLK